MQAIPVERDADRDGDIGASQYNASAQDGRPPGKETISREIQISEVLPALCRCGVKNHKAFS